MEGEGVKLKPDVVNLQRWNQRVRKRLAMATGTVAAQQDSKGEAGARVSYNTAITACDNLGQWQQVLVLFRELLEDKLKPDVISYSATVSAFETGGKCEEALALFKRDSSLNSWIVSCRSGG
ncbi:unnamed protein product [Prorocentrum cordatum]|uniref:Uncharacterized protein n=1 Tax=Prorocentrum cordatum TaxID=2364126 RepID=A0ABN9RKY4_9DINO|nr:unnamed protein product [Polarella glacialis]